MHLMLPVCMNLEKDFTHVIFTIVKMCTSCFSRVLCPGTLCQSGVGVISCHIVLQSATFYVVLCTNLNLGIGESLLAFI